MADDKKVLNLDEVFGQDRPIKVKWQGREYELLRLEAFSPREIHAFSRMQAETQKLQAAPDPSTARVRSAQDGEGSDEEQDERIVALFDEMLKALCKDLPLDQIPFLAKTRIITFYIEETQGKKALEDAMMNAQPIGATS